MKTLSLSALVSLFLCGCSSLSSEKERPVDWYFQIATPAHYDVWVENIEFERSGVRHWYHPAGSLGCCWKGPNGPRGITGGMEPFPNFIGIQWFSFAEQKFYQRLIIIPDEWQELMRAPARYVTSLGEFYGPRNILALGLAPGGEIVVWIKNQIGNEIEIARLQANEIEGNPEDYAPLMPEYLEESGAYLKQHGVPTNKW
ncbi:MAG: DUF2931 family protein [Marinobacter sp.]|uniref:DUF2931 family protein n=1 Tax=Marinobacter sp. TaxID=50741 RepID=UPI003F9E2D0C